MNKVRWYQLAPVRLYFVDNAAGFGHRDEIDLGRPSRFSPRSRARASLTALGTLRISMP